jgi:tellurite resistance protein
MTHADPSRANLAILVDGLVAFLHQQQKLQKRTVPGPFPDELARVFAMSGHHIVALMLVARSDDELVATERQAILRHCADRAQRAGEELSPAERASLYDYMREFRPNLSQFISAMEQLKKDSKDELADLIAAAREVVEADGVVRLQEALYITSLQRDLHAL